MSQFGFLQVCIYSNVHVPMYVYHAYAYVCILVWACVCVSCLCMRICIPLLFVRSMRMGMWLSCLWCGSLCSHLKISVADCVWVWRWRMCSRHLQHVYVLCMCVNTICCLRPACVPKRLCACMRACACVWSSSCMYVCMYAYACADDTFWHPHRHIAQVSAHGAGR